MGDYLISCRSLTYVQRAAAVLGRAGITARIFRTPRSIAGAGCGHSVGFPRHKLDQVLWVLEQNQVAYSGLYESTGPGTYREVDL